MRSFRWLWIAAGAIAVLILLAIAVGAVWLNTFIHSDAFRHEVETRASQTLGGTVRIQAIDFSIFSGVKLQGVVTDVDSSRVNGRDHLVAKVETVDCIYALDDLLHRRLKLTGVTLEHPELVVTSEPAKIIPPAPSDAAETGETAGGDAAPVFQFILEGAKVKTGSFSVRSSAGATVVDLQGINGDMNTAGLYEGKEVTGNIKIADVAFPANLHLTDFSTPMVYGPRGSFISAKPMEATAFGGRLAGDYELETAPASGAAPLTAAASVLEVNGKGLDVGQISRMANPTSSIRLSGSLDLQSKWEGVETGAVRGEGDGQLSNGRLEGVPVLQDLAAVFRVNELYAPKLRKVQTHFQIANGETRFTGLQLDAGAFQMTGDGVIGPKGGLDANMVLIMSRDAMARLPAEAAVFFIQRPDGSASIGFHVGGSVNRPQTDLATRLFIQNMKVQNVIGKVLNRFFHHREKTAPAEVAPTSNPEPAPPAEEPAGAASPNPTIGP